MESREEKFKAYREEIASQVKEEAPKVLLNNHRVFIMSFNNFIHSHC